MAVERSGLSVGIRGVVVGIENLDFVSPLKIYPAVSAPLTFALHFRRSRPFHMKLDVTEFLPGHDSAASQAAATAGRPIKYLAGASDKETLARELAQKDRIQEGLIALFTAVEPCLSYSVRAERTSKMIQRVLEARKCLHLYHYCQHPHFGLMHVGVQTWFPFRVDVCLNGRKWAAHQMNAAGLRYFQRDNCFSWVKDPLKVQSLFAGQLHTDWAKSLDGLLDQAHPLHREISRPFHPDRPLRWQKLRRGVADLWRRGQVSQASNRRYLDALASVTGTTPLWQESQPVCRPVRIDGRRFRALNPWSPEDGALLEAVSRGRRIITALLAARNANVDQLMQFAA